MLKGKRPITKQLKADVAQLVTHWSDIRLKGYVEPLRAGTTKGDPIGFSSQKMRAAIFMALYPHVMRLKDISNTLNVPVNTLKVWRTQKDFQNVSLEELSELGFDISKYIRYTFDSSGYVTPLLKKMLNIDHERNPIEILNVLFGSLSYLNVECKKGAFLALANFYGDPPPLSILLLWLTFTRDPWLIFDNKITNVIKEWIDCCELQTKGKPITEPGLRIVHLWPLVNDIIFQGR